MKVQPQPGCAQHIASAVVKKRSRVRPREAVHFPRALATQWLLSFDVYSYPTFGRRCHMPPLLCELCDLPSLSLPSPSQLEAEWNISLFFVQSLLFIELILVVLLMCLFLLQALKALSNLISLYCWTWRVFFCSFFRLNLITTFLLSLSSF